MGMGSRRRWLWGCDNKHKHKHSHSHSSAFLVALKLKMKCPICLEHKFVGTMVKIDGCSHTFCYSCMKRYMEAQYYSKKRNLPKCPNPRCETKLINIHRYMKFLPLTSMTNLKLLMKYIVLASDQIHCPYPKCFALMSLTKALEGKNIGGDDHYYSKCTRKCRSTNVDGNQGKCIRCNGQFCVNCRVPWHSNMTCVEYRRLNPTAEVDAQFSALVSRMGWSKCPKCTQTIERVSGCPEMQCRCGMEFIYEWYSSI